MIPWSKTTGMIIWSFAKIIIKIRSIYNCIPRLLQQELDDVHIRAIWPKLRVRFQRAEYPGEKSINSFVGPPTRIHLSIVIPTIFQHHVTFRNLSEGKGTVRLNSGQHRCFAILTSLLLYLLLYFVLFKWVRRGGLDG